MKVTEKYVLFWGGVFSNFHPCSFEADGNKFSTSEQYFMYHKALTFGDYETADKILKTDEPSKAKKLGRQVKNFDDYKWSLKRYDVMKNACKLKYDNNPELKKELMSYHGKTFVEASPHDCIWGIGMGEDNPLAEDSANWYGSNLLGQVLTELRDEYEKIEEDTLSVVTGISSECTDLETIITRLRENFDISEIIDEIGLDVIVDNCSKSELLMEIDNIDIYTHKDLDDVLTYYDNDEVADYLDNKGFDFTEYIGSTETEKDVEDDEESDGYIKYHLTKICNILKPNGYLGKEEMKEKLIDYIDFNFN